MVTRVGFELMSKREIGLPTEIADLKLMNKALPLIHSQKKNLIGCKIYKNMCIYL